MLGGAYSSQFKNIERQHVDTIKTLAVNEKSDAVARAKKLSVETNRRRRFVGDRKRMNVSLTRAKYAMYLVGRFESLEVSDEWKALLADARHRRKIINVDQFSMQDAIKQILRNL